MMKILTANEVAEPLVEVLKKEEAKLLDAIIQMTITKRICAPVNAKNEQDEKGRQIR